MKIVSFDPGLRNLACCVLEGTSRADCRIVHWGIFDVLAEASGTDRQTCSKCSSPACWLQASTGTHVCSRHKPRTIKAPTKKVLATKSLADLQEMVSKIGVTPPSNKTACINVVYTHNRQSVWVRSVKSANGSGSVLDLCAVMVRLFDRYSAWWQDADMIVVENQMDRRMFGVQAMLHMYFSSRGYVCRGVSATHKLTNLLTMEDTVGTYKGRKKTGITHALALVPPEWKDHLSKHPKKDDLADAFLQGLWAMEHFRQNK